MALQKQWTESSIQNSFFWCNFYKPVRPLMGFLCSSCRSCTWYQENSAWPPRLVWQQPLPALSLQTNMRSHPNFELVMSPTADLLGMPAECREPSTNSMEAALLVAFKGFDSADKGNIKYTRLASLPCSAYAGIIIFLCTHFVHVICMLQQSTSAIWYRVQAHFR